MTERHEGPFGWAERCPVPSHPGGTTLDVWFMELPDQGLGWDNFALFLIHLRPAAGVPPANLDYPTATHEIMLVALDPHHNLTPASPHPWPHLTPINARVQFHGVTDNQARETASELAWACTQGYLPAESSVYMLSGPEAGKIKLIKQVLDLWEDTVRATAHHHRDPTHGRGN